MVTYNPSAHNSLFERWKQRIHGPKPSQQLNGGLSIRTQQAQAMQAFGDTITLTKRERTDQLVYTLNDQDDVRVKEGQQFRSLEGLTKYVVHHAEGYDATTRSLKKQHSQVLEKGGASAATLNNILGAWGVRASQDRNRIGEE